MRKRGEGHLIVTRDAVFGRGGTSGPLVSRDFYPVREVGATRVSPLLKVQSANQTISNEGREGKGKITQSSVWMGQGRTGNSTGRGGFASCRIVWGVEANGPQLLRAKRLYKAIWGGSNA